MPGETLEIISNKIGTPIEELRRINGLMDNNINSTYIIIPKMNMNSSYGTYIVKPGDNMYAIARNNNIDLDTLLKYNGLNKDDYIYPNQEILIPNRNTYITKDKDTVKDLMNLNINMDKLDNLYLKEDQIIEL